MRIRKISNFKCYVPFTKPLEENMKKITILEFPSNLGLKQLDKNKEPGVYKLPNWLKENGFYDALEISNIETLPRFEYSMKTDEETKVRNGKKIREYALLQSELLGKRIKTSKTFSLVIGGDCSILIGNALALKENGNFGLFFLDGHTDFSWPEFSGTGGVAGMDLGIVTGYGHNKLTNINGLKPYFEEENVWCVGNRDFDEKYIDLIEKSEIEYIDLNELRKESTTNCVNRFIKHIEQNDLDGFWIHLDVDVLNDSIMPLVDSREKDGLSYSELGELLIPLLQHEKVYGMEITILDPDLDDKNKYTTMFIENMVKIIESVTKQF